jgi:hypothetical protein
LSGQQPTGSIVPGSEGELVEKNWQAIKTAEGPRDGLAALLGRMAARLLMAVRGGQAAALSGPVLAEGPAASLEKGEGDSVFGAAGAPGDARRGEAPGFGEFGAEAGVKAFPSERRPAEEAIGEVLGEPGGEVFRRVFWKGGGAAAAKLYRRQKALSRLPWMAAPELFAASRELVLHEGGQARKALAGMAGPALAESGALPESGSAMLAYWRGLIMGEPANWPERGESLAPPEEAAAGPKPALSLVQAEARPGGGWLLERSLLMAPARSQAWAGARMAIPWASASAATGFGERAKALAKERARRLFVEAEALAAAAPPASQEPSRPGQTALCRLVMAAGPAGRSPAKLLKDALRRTDNGKPRLKAGLGWSEGLITERLPQFLEAAVCPVAGTPEAKSGIAVVALTKRGLKKLALDTDLYRVGGGMSFISGWGQVTWGGNAFRVCPMPWSSPERTRAHDPGSCRRCEAWVAKMAAEADPPGRAESREKLGGGLKAAPEPPSLAESRPADPAGAAPAELSRGQEAAGRGSAARKRPPRPKRGAPLAETPAAPETDPPVQAECPEKLGGGLKAAPEPPSLAESRPADPAGEPSPGQEAAGSGPAARKRPPRAKRGRGAPAAQIPAAEAGRAPGGVGEARGCAQDPARPLRPNRSRGSARSQAGQGEPTAGPALPRPGSPRGIEAS